LDVQSLAKSLATVLTRVRYLRYICERYGSATAPVILAHGQQFVFCYNLIDIISTNLGVDPPLADAGFQLDPPLAVVGFQFQLLYYIHQKKSGVKGNRDTIHDMIAKSEWFSEVVEAYKLHHQKGRNYLKHGAKWDAHVMNKIVKPITWWLSLSNTWNNEQRELTEYKTFSIQTIPTYFSRIIIMHLDMSGNVQSYIAGEDGNSYVSDKNIQEPGPITSSASQCWLQGGQYSTKFIAQEDIKCHQGIVTWAFDSLSEAYAVLKRIPSTKETERIWWSALEERNQKNNQKLLTSTNKLHGLQISAIIVLSIVSGEKFVKIDRNIDQTLIGVRLVLRRKSTS
jgi:hypothetical protein